MSEDRRAALQAELARRQSLAPPPPTTPRPDTLTEAQKTLDVPLRAPEVGTRPPPAPEPSNTALEEAQRRGIAPEGQQASAMTPGAGFASLGRQKLGEFFEGLGRAGDDPSPGEMVGDFFRSMVPTRAGREARYREMDKLGDIGTFASGGLMNPIGVGAGSKFPAIPGGAPGEATRGLGMGPRPAPPTPPAQGPPLALPPPFGGPAAPPRALPPPTVGVPGRPIPTPGPSPEQFSRQPSQPPQFAFDRASSAGPPTGSIPRPGATMRSVPEPPPRPAPTAAETAGAAAGRDLPPRAPGTEGRPATAVQPLIPQGAERGHASPLATALLENDATAIDRKLSNRFRQATGSPRARSQGELDTQDQQMTTAVDSMIAAKDNIRFRDPKDPTGNTLLKPGQLPRNLSEFTQGIAYLKKQIFEQYDQMATRATGQGAQVSLAPTVAKLRQWAASPSAGVSRSIRNQALQMADEFEQLGSYSPSGAQEVVQTLNGELSNFLNGRGTQEIYSHPTLMNEVRDTLLGSLNGTMKQALGGPQYQILRNRYGSLSAVEGNVANALSKQLGKSGGPFSRGLTTPEAMAALAGTLHFGPIGGMAAVGATESARGLSRFLYSPNYAIKTMFDRRAASLAPPPPSTTDYLSSQIASRLPNPPQRPPGPAYVGTSGM